jgi:hypothetical protein
MFAKLEFSFGVVGARYTYKPKTGPKQEKKQTGKTPSKLKKRTVSMASATPNPQMPFPRMPMAKDETTRLADSHYRHGQHHAIVTQSSHLSNEATMSDQG